MTVEKYNMQIRNFESNDRNLLGKKLNENIKLKKENHQVYDNINQNKINQNTDYRIRKLKMEKSMTEDDKIDQKIKNKKIAEQRLKYLKFHDD